MAEELDVNGARTVVNSLMNLFRGIKDADKIITVLEQHEQKRNNLIGESAQLGVKITEQTAILQGINKDIEDAKGIREIEKKQGEADSANEQTRLKQEAANLSSDLAVEIETLTKEKKQLEDDNESLKKAQETLKENEGKLIKELEDKKRVLTEAIQGLQAQAQKLANTNVG